MILGQKQQDRSIWQNPYTLEQIEEFTKNTLVSHMGIKVIKIGDNYLVGTMPVDHRSKQPRGILHGGASVAFAESLGSLGANMAAKADKQCVGLEINANHLQRVTEGFLVGIAKPMHIGRSTHVWQIQITSESGKLICVSRLTMAVIEKPQDTSDEPQEFDGIK